MRYGSCFWKSFCNGWGTIRLCRNETICGTTLPTARKDSFVQSQYGQERVVRFRAGTWRRHLHPCRRACRQLGFSHAGEIYLWGGGREFCAATCSPTCKGAGFRTRISGGRAKNTGLQRAERLSLGARNPLRSSLSPLSVGQLPRTRKALFRHRVSERVRRLGTAQQTV